MAATTNAGGLPPRLQLDGITVAFGGRTALADVSLRVEPGTVAGIIGPNGAGKSTLLSVVAGAVQPSAGTLLFDGAPLRPAPHKLSQLGIARTIQGLGLDDTKLVADHVLDGAVSPPRTGFGAALRALPGRGSAAQGVREHAIGLLREFGLGPVADREAGTLPHHQRVRVALASALVSSPRLLLLDELAGGLDDDEVRELGATIAALISRPGRDLAVVLVEHRIQLVDDVCDTVLVLDEGRTVTQASPAALRADPAIAAEYLTGSAGGPAV